MKSKLFLFTLLLGLMGLVSCQKDKDVAPEEFPIQEEDIEISEHVVNMDEASTGLTLISSPEELENGIYKFQSSNGEFPAWDHNSVLVSAENGGYLRRVLSVSESGNVATLITEQGNLTDVIKNGRITLDFSFIDMGRGGKDFEEEEILQQSLDDGVSTSDHIEYHLNTEFTDEIALTGNIKFNPHFNFVFDIEDGAFKEVKIAIENTVLEVNTTLSLEAQARLQASLEKNLGNVDKRYLFFIGFLPVVMDLELVLIGSVRSSFEGGVDMSISYNNRSNLDFGAEYINGTAKFIKNFDNESTLANELNVQAEGQAIFYLIPQIYVEFYSALSSAIKAEPYLDFYGRATGGTGPNDICAELEAGIDFTLAFSETMFDLFDLSTRIEGPSSVIWETEGGCELSRLKIGEPTVQFVQSDPWSVCGAGFDALYDLTYSYEYKDQSGDRLATPAEMTLLWRDNAGQQGILTFPLQESDPFHTITADQFIHAICVSWYGRASYELSAYVVDQNGIESNYVSFLLLE